MDTLKLALDWTPNINHIGIFVAEHQGFYRDHDLTVEILDPSTDNYATTPAKLVETGRAHVALCPTESLISYRTKAEPFPLIAIAALLQEDLSAIAVRGDGPIHTPRDLDGKTYASYQARYEDEIVKQVIRNDGGRGDLHLEYPEKLGIWDTLVERTYDATWVFRNWEGVEAEALDVPLRYFDLKDYDIPYGYSPVLAVSETDMREHTNRYKRFLDATKRGYMFTQENPGEALSILTHELPERDRHISIKRALALTTPYLGDPDTWGRMDGMRMTGFVDWIYRHGLESKRVPARSLFTNDLLP